MAAGLTLGQKLETGARKKAMVLFAVGLLLGIGVPVAGGFGTGSASAAPNTVGQSATLANEDAAVTYSYQRISAADAYPLYTTAAFTAAGGLFVYALTYIPVRSKARARSQYASRVATWAKTTY